MIRLFLAFIILLASVYVGTLLYAHPGYFLIVINQWTIETSLSFFIIALILTFLVLHTIWNFTHKLTHIPSAWRRFREQCAANRLKRKEKKALFRALEQQQYFTAISAYAKNNQEKAFNQLIRQMPRRLRHDPDILKEHMQFLLKNNQTLQAEAILRKHLRKNRDSDLIGLYGECGQVRKALIFAEGLLKKRGPSAPLFLCLGQLCMTQHLWGKAKNYLEQSIVLQPTPQAYMHLGLLQEMRNEPEEACASFKQGLKEST